MTKFRVDKIETGYQLVSQTETNYSETVKSTHNTEEEAWGEFERISLAWAATQVEAMRAWGRECAASEFALCARGDGDGRRLDWHYQPRFDGGEVLRCIHCDVTDMAGGYSHPVVDFAYAVAVEAAAEEWDRLMTALPAK